MNDRKKKILKISFLVLIIIFFIIKALIEDNQLEKNHRFTIGSIFSFEKKGRNGYMFENEYYVGGEKYKSIQNIYENRRDLVGKRFYVKFNPDNPDNCLMLLDYPVPDCIKEAPAEGWEKIPTKCP